MSGSDQEDEHLFQKDASEPSFEEGIHKTVLKWENIKVTIKQEKTVMILDNVSGFANPQQILAIMGGSGAGKTTLLSILSQTLVLPDNCVFTGEVSLNTHNCKDIAANKFIRYIPQEPVLYDFLTPYECLKFSAKLKLENPKQAIKRINEILKEFKLANVAHTPIGNALLKGLSGGEKKRLSIALEMITYPSVLILDEPTSGLDSFLANSVMESIKDVLKFGVAVIVSIHQPSKSILQKLDRLVLMQEGRIVYQGKMEDSLEYFLGLGFAVDRCFNPPEYYMKLLKVVDRKNLSEEEKQTMRILNENYQRNESSVWVDMKKFVSEDSEIFEKKYHAGLFTAMKMLIWREYLQSKRNIFLIGIKVAQVVAFAMFLDLVFFRLGYDNEGMENRQGVMFFYFMSLTFFTLFQYAVRVTYEKRIAKAEMKDEIYSLDSYLLSKFLFDLPFFFIGTMIMVLIMYWVIDLNDDSLIKPFVFYIIGVMAQFIGVAAGILAGTLCPNVMVTVFVSSTIMLSMYLFAGFFADVDSIPEVTRWLKYTTPLYFLRNAILKNEFEDLDYDSDVDPKPKDRFNYEREIYENLLYPFLHIIAFYMLSRVIYMRNFQKN